MMEQMILALCLNVSAPEHEACRQALTAASIQTKLKAELDGFQSDIEKRVTKETNETMWLVGGFSYTTFVKHQMVFSLNAKPVADNVNINMTPDTKGAGLTWSF